MPADNMAPSILAVIVLYKLTPENSVTFRTLQQAREHVSPEKLPLKILLYDNSPGHGVLGTLPPDVHYESSANNTGLSAAYNRALEIAETGNYSWILTLDQDTHLPESFLLDLSEILADVHRRSEIAAVVPQISEKNRMLSPNYLLLNAIPRFFPRGFTGISPDPAFAFNSASTLRVDALREVGGYSNLFWLDYCDAYIYNRLNRAGKSIYIAGNIQVEHEFSLFDIKNRMTVERYRNIVNDGSAFCDIERGTLAGLYHTASLIYRLYRHWRRGDDPQIRAITRGMLRKRITQNKTRRIAAWRSQVNARSEPASPPAPAELRRPKISVCMAAYNGERYIEAQLRSILSQLRQDDEIIVVDDASSDATTNYVRRLGDPRVRLIENPTNRGVLLAFEAAIRAASGKIIFLSDQDDLWEAEKVSTVLQAFRDNPETNVVLTDAFLIDEHGAALPGTYFAKRGGFRAGLLSNIFRSRYHGCVMAFRSELIAGVLPFPAGLDVLHDVWIGARNQILGGKVLFIDKPLVCYRRHSHNVTGTRRLSRLRQLRIRLHLIRALMSFKPGADSPFG